MEELKLNLVAKVESNLVLAELPGNRGVKKTAVFYGALYLQSEL